MAGPGVVLGERYRLATRIAVGGQGEVWTAEDAALGRTVAVKVLRGEYTGDHRFRDRFRREARHAAALSHPGVAQVFDYDEGGGDVPPYLVMEYVAGESLAAAIARSAPLPFDRVLEVIAAVASALSAAHAAGVVHRDVKPGNLLVGRDGTIKITDFGIARAVDAAPLTQTGTLMGTPSYLPPEAASGRPVGAAGDLYALGVIAFEMLTGRPPYEGPAPAVMLAHRDAPLPPLPAGVPPALRDLVMTLTAKNPSARPVNAATVARHAEELRAAARTHRPDAVAPDGELRGGTVVPPEALASDAEMRRSAAGGPSATRAFGGSAAGGPSGAAASGGQVRGATTGGSPEALASEGSVRGAVDGGPSGAVTPGAGPRGTMTGHPQEAVAFGEEPRGATIPVGTWPHGRVPEAPMGSAGGDTRVLLRPTAAERPGRRRTLLLAAAGLAIAVLAGLLGWLLAPSPGGGTTVQPTPSASSSSPAATPTLHASRRPPVVRQEHPRQGAKPEKKVKGKDKGKGHGGHGGKKGPG